MSPNPYISTVIRCAGPNCDRIRGENNHWLMCRSNPVAFYIEAWNSDGLGDDRIKPLCGDQCASKLFARFLSDLKCAESTVAKEANRS